MRDLKKDLELCEKATPGPWERTGITIECENDHMFTWGSHSFRTHNPNDDYKNFWSDFKFIAESREGWPHAIKRALTHESQLTEIIEILNEYLEWGPMTGSDKDYFEQKFTNFLQKAEV